MTKSINAHISNEAHKILKIQAEEWKLTINDAIERMIMNYK